MQFLLLDSGWSALQVETSIVNKILNGIYILSPRFKYIFNKISENTRFDWPANWTKSNIEYVTSSIDNIFLSRLSPNLEIYLANTSVAGILPKIILH